MEVRLRFLDIPIEPYYIFTLELIDGIAKKVNNTPIELPYIPNKSMMIDLPEFKDVFKFNQDELEALNDCNELFKITNIVINPSYTEVWLS
jgi:hypothetical protein